MGADSALAAQGEDEIVDTGLAPSDDSRDAIGESFDSQLGRALLEGLGVPDDFGRDVADEQPEALPSDEDEAETPHGEATTPATDAPPSIEEQMPRWVEQVRGNPKSINQIPAKHHPAIMQAIFDGDRASQLAAVQAAHDQGLQRARDEFAAQQRHREDLQLVTQIDARKNNPEVNAEDALTGLEWYAKLRDSVHPEDIALLQRYDATREAIRNPQAAQQQQNAQALALAAFQAAAAPLRKQLDGVPEAKAKLEAKLAANPTLYGPTAEGMEQFAADVAEAIADARVNARMTKEAPARAALEQRQANTAERRTAPRPDVSAGQRGGEPLTDDVDELFRLGLEEAFRGPNAKTMAVH